MKKLIKTSIMAAVLAVVLQFGAILAPSGISTFNNNVAVSAHDDPTNPGHTHSGATDDICEGVGLLGNGSGCGDEAANEGAVSSILGVALNLLSMVVGVISVIMIIIGGLRYITSQGDANNTKGAKDTILYAIIGLVVVAVAQIVVRFVLNRAAAVT